MAGFDGSGNFVRSDGTLTGSNICATQESTSVGIQAARFDNELNTIATGLENCLTRDQQTALSTSFDFNSQKGINLAAGTASTDAVRMSQLVANGAIQLGSLGGTAPNYTATTALPLSAYGDGQTFAFNVASRAAGNVTVNINTLGAASIQDADSNTIDGLKMPYFGLITYSTVNSAFVLVNDQYQNTVFSCGATGGTSTAYTASATPQVYGYYDGLLVSCRTHTASGASPTINIDSVGAKPIVTPSDNAIIANEIPSGALLTLAYDSNFDAFVLVNQPRSVIDYTPTISAGGSMTVSSVTEDTRYSIDGACIDMQMDASFTLGGTASNQINVSLPVSPLIFLTGVALDVTDNSGRVGVQAYTQNISNVIEILTENGANFTLGTGGTIRLMARYFFRSSY